MGHTATKQADLLPVLQNTQDTLVDGEPWGGGCC
jgi:hypothetical protein